MTKYTRAWKAEQLRKTKEISVKTRNRSFKFRLKGSNMYLAVGDKEYTVLNPEATLRAVADEKDFIEVQIANPDESVNSKLLLQDLEISPRIW